MQEKHRVVSSVRTVNFIIYTNSWMTTTDVHIPLKLSISYYWITFMGPVRVFYSKKILQQSSLKMFYGRILSCLFKGFFLDDSWLFKTSSKECVSILHRSLKLLKLYYYYSAADKYVLAIAYHLYVSHACFMEGIHRRRSSVIFFLLVR